MSEGVSASRLLMQKWLSWKGTTRSSEELPSCMAQSRWQVDMDASTAQAGVQVPSCAPGPFMRTMVWGSPLGPDAVTSSLWVNSAACSGFWSSSVQKDAGKRELWNEIFLSLNFFSLSESPQFFFHFPLTLFSLLDTFTPTIEASHFLKSDPFIQFPFLRFHSRQVTSPWVTLRIFLLFLLTFVLMKRVLSRGWAQPLTFTRSGILKTFSWSLKMFCAFFTAATFL